MRLFKWISDRISGLINFYKDLDSFERQMFIVVGMFILAGVLAVSIHICHVAFPYRTGLKATWLNVYGTSIPEFCYGDYMRVYTTGNPSYSFSIPTDKIEVIDKINTATRNNLQIDAIFDVYKVDKCSVAFVITDVIVHDNPPTPENSNSSNSNENDQGAN